MTATHDQMPGLPRSRSDRRQFLVRTMSACAGAVCLGVTPVVIGREHLRAAGAAAAQDLDFTTRQAFDELEDMVSAFDLEHETNDDRLLTWQGSYVNLSYVFMYHAHGDQGYLDKLIDHTDAVLASRDNERGVTDAYRGTAEPAWSAVREVDGVEDRHLDASHTGMITYPMISYVRTVQETPELSDHPTYGAKADEYLQAVRDAVAVHDIQYEETDSGLGSYRFLKGEHYDPDGIEYPHNKALALGRVLIHLAAITGENQYQDKAAGLARTLRSDLEVDSATAYVWPYHWTLSWGYQGWSSDDDVSENRPSFDGNQRVEDISHGALDIEFAVLAHQDGIVFEDSDLDKFAATFIENLVFQTDSGGYETRYNVDGTGRTGDPRDAIVAGHYLPLTPWDSSIFDMTRWMYEDLGIPSGSAGARRSRGSGMLTGSGLLNQVAEAAAGGAADGKWSR